MSPTISTGSTIFTLPADEYKVDDVITFRSQGEEELITHRVVQVEQIDDQIYYITRGDANDVSDSYKVPQIGVAGKVRFHIPLLGYLTEFIKKPIGLMIIIVIPATIIIYSEILKIKREISNLKKKKPMN